MFWSRENDREAWRSLLVATDIRARSPISPCDFGLTWTCQSPEGCERTDAIMLVDRLNVSGNRLFFHSTRTTAFASREQRVGCIAGSVRLDMRVPQRM